MIRLGVAAKSLPDLVQRRRLHFSERLESPPLPVFIGDLLHLIDTFFRQDDTFQEFRASGSFEIT
jgi:hypothetical protein